MKIKVISFGKLRENYFKAAQDEYLKRIEKFVNIDITEDVKEADIDKSDFVIALDEKGKEMDSAEFAELIRRLEIEGKKICFVVGNWSGLEEKIKGEANLILSLSKLTFPYQLARIILLEQIYRAFTIIRGIGYHK